MNELPLNPVTFPPGETNLLIDGPRGHLELLTFAAKGLAKGVGVICHPHPLHEGSMHNKVVHTLSRAFHRKELMAVRFNFRGVGKSEGEFGGSIGEVEDLKAVLNWIDLVLNKPKIWLAGFSFGSYIAAKVAADHLSQQLYTVAPAVNHQPFDDLPPINCPWVVIQGEADEVIPAPIVYEWFKEHSKRQDQMTLIKVPNASHFFHGDLITLRDLVEGSLIS